MPFRKFRSVHEMSGARWREPGDAALYRAIAAVWAFGARTGVFRFPRGVHRHRSIEEMDRATETWQRANFEESQARRRSA